MLVFQSLSVESHHRMLGGSFNLTELVMLLRAFASELQQRMVDPRKTEHVMCRFVFVSELQQRLFYPRNRHVICRVGLCLDKSSPPTAMHAQFGHSIRDHIDSCAAHGLFVVLSGRIGATILSRSG